MPDTQRTEIAWASLDRLSAGLSATCDLVVSEKDVVDFARLSLDTNPLHMDANVARDYGFPRAVAHGMLALSAISRLIGTELPGPGSLWVSQELQFLGPVLVGDALTARVTVERFSRAAGLVSLRTEVVNKASGAVVLSGTAKVKVFERVASGGGPAGSRDEAAHTS